MDVLEASAKLEEEGHQFEFLLLEEKSNREVIEALGMADIAVDARDTWPGVFGIEAMAQSCVLVGGADWKFEEMPKSPAIPFPDSTADLVVELRTLLGDIERRNTLMANSWRYWNAHYSPDAFFAYFRRIWKGTEKQIFPLDAHSEMPKPLRVLWSNLNRKKGGKIN